MRRVALRGIGALECLLGAFALLWPGAWQEALHPAAIGTVFYPIQALAAGWSRDRIIAEISQAGFPAFSGSCSEIYLEDTFRKQGLGPAERLPVARELGETSLAFLVDPGWSQKDIARLAQVIVDVGNQALAGQKAG